MSHHTHEVAHALGLNREVAKQAASVLPKLFQAFLAKDMSLLEINPLVVTKSAS